MRKLTKMLLGGALAFSALSSQAAAFVGDRTDFRDETIYFAMTTRFYDGDPKNNVCSWDKQDVQIANGDPDWRGDFKGLIDKLDYIKALGFTAVWITPVVQNASGEDYHGYHAMDFSKVDLRYESRKEWGSEKDVKFQDLIDAAHAKGMKIILDVVLQHTGNFGEAYLNPLFTRDQNIRNQATPAGSLHPNERLSSNYFGQDAKAQYAERWKYFKNPQYEPNNYYHHYGTGWNWDLPNRWWGQIAGDCVDLNTENNYVADYIVKCYGEFIKMGVDGFRIDTTGHISPLTFNKQFIPRFQQLGEQYKSKRLNGAPFYMFGECCQRFQGSVVYRNQPNLSSYFYTWKSDQSLLNEFNGDPAWWRQQNLPEGHDTPVGPMAVCEKDTKDKPRSNNAWMQNGQWHEPDYSQASGLNVIDFPMHYSFSSAASAISYANQDNYYNDASFNVVYVDSHDYCPGPNDGTRFNGGTAQWAENLALMFTFRGIPCIYYGSEVEFKKGLPIDVGGDKNKTPRKNSGRAYFGNYLEGSVTASDFGAYKASGNVAQTLNGDLSQHIRRLNQIRAAVPALRKGQYTFDGCSANGGQAFKRAYKDSYALVALNGGATFTNVPAGTYVDLVTGKSYQGGGTITVDAPRTQGQVRVLVKDWKGGKVGEDGKFIYGSAPVSHGGAVTFPDVPATQFYTADDVIESPAVTLSPAGGTFKTETMTVTAALNETATSGWYKVGNQAQQNLTPGKTASFTIGNGMNFGETVTVSWSATDGKTNYTGKATYKKIDPNAAITIYVRGKDGADISKANMYVWGDSNGTTTEPFGKWPGNAIGSLEKDANGFYSCTVAELSSVNVIFNNNGSQTGDITGITEDTWFEYDGATSASKVDAPGPVTKSPRVAFNPNGGSFRNTVTVTATAQNATEAWYTIGNGSETKINGTSATFTLGENMNPGTSVTVTWRAKNDTETKSGSVTFTKQDANTGITVYCKADAAPFLYTWSGTDELNGKWPGKQMSETALVDGMNFFKQTFDASIASLNLIFNNNNGGQTGDITGITEDVYYIYDGNTNAQIYTPQHLGVNGIANPLDSIRVIVENGMVFIASDITVDVPIVSLTGLVRYVHVEPGITPVEGLHGFNIVGGRKVLLP